MAREFMEHCALPLDTATEVQRSVPSALNVTVPVGTLPVTDAVKEIFWPEYPGLAEESSIVELVVFTICVRSVELFGALFRSPEYTATIV
jgi:hypothetical protein